MFIFLPSLYEFTCPLHVFHTSQILFSLAWSLKHCPGSFSPDLLVIFLLFTQTFTWKKGANKKPANLSAPLTAGTEHQELRVFSGKQVGGSDGAGVGGWVEGHSQQGQNGGGSEEVLPLFINTSHRIVKLELTRIQAFLWVWVTAGGGGRCLGRAELRMEPEESFEGRELGCEMFVFSLRRHGGFWEIETLKVRGPLVHAFASKVIYRTLRFIY